MHLDLEPGAGPLRGELRPPGDKSISHRAVLFAALAQGTSEIHGFLDAADTRATLAACRALGAGVDEVAGRLVIRGAGLAAWRLPEAALDLGNSGTGARLLLGALAPSPVTATIIGDESLSRRPMDRVIEPLARMGADFTARDGRFLPVTVRGRPLTGCRHDLPVASAQVKSALLLAGLHAAGLTVIREPGPSRDHSERLLADFGARLRRDGLQVAVEGGQRLRAAPVAVPADLSSAAFMIVAATLNPGSEIVLREVGVNPSRTGIIDLLRRMGGDITIEPRPGGAEPRADLVVRGAPLKAIEIEHDDVVRSIDELPVLMVAAALAEGTTRIRGAAELRVKESDRLAVMCRGLAALGVDLTEYPDGVDIAGRPGGDRLRGGVVDGAGDHRCAMSFAVLATRLGAPLTVTGAAQIATSYPAFAADIAALGVRIEVRRAPA